MQYSFFNDTRFTLVVIWLMTVVVPCAFGESPTGISANTPVGQKVVIPDDTVPVGPKDPQLANDETGPLGDLPGDAVNKGALGVSSDNKAGGKVGGSGGISANSAIEERSIVRSTKEGASKSQGDSGGKKKPQPKVWRLVLSLSLVLMLIVGISWLYRRYVPGGKLGGHSGAIEIIARNSINPKQSLCMVKVGGRLLLVGLSPNHMASLDSIDDPDEIARIMGQIESQSANSVTKSFQGIFNNEANEYDSEQDGGDDYGETSQWRDDGRELSRLLSKVKSLTKMRFRS